MSESLNQNLILLFWVLRSNKSLINFSCAFEIVDKTLGEIRKDRHENPKFDLGTPDIFQT